MDYVKVGASQCMNHSLIIRFHFGIFPDVLEKLVSYWMLYQNNCSNLLGFCLGEHQVHCVKHFPSHSRMLWAFKYYIIVEVSHLK